MTAFEAIFFVAGFVLGGLATWWCYEGVVRNIREEIEERWRAALCTGYDYRGRR